MKLAPNPNGGGNGAGAQPERRWGMEPALSPNRVRMHPEQDAHSAPTGIGHSDAQQRYAPAGENLSTASVMIPSTPLATSHCALAGSFTV
jgi:hypothetical protein